MRSPGESGEIEGKRSQDTAARRNDSMWRAGVASGPEGKPEEHGIAGAREDVGLIMSV